MILRYIYPPQLPQYGPIGAIDGDSMTFAIENFTNNPVCEVSAAWSQNNSNGPNQYPDDFNDPNNANHNSITDCCK